ncbi:MAG: hypothetical protein IJN50_03125 [Clostridia bacterium]|nr:hypothetical protein [Clostridiales bacterium]MBQ6991893.1 hypothetical protein [Clostridia bacterium]
MKETISNSESVSKNEEVLKGISNFAKTIKVGSTSNIDELEMNEENGEITPTSSSTFKVCTNTLPEKTSTWTKVKNVLCYKIEVKLTPYEQKIEDEINEFLHQEITWGKIKDFLMQEVDITFRGKKIF